MSFSFKAGAKYPVFISVIFKKQVLNSFPWDHCQFFWYSHFLLGFSDQSAFNHAFKRWTGTSSGDYFKTRKSITAV
jgi:hypothetical protein